VKLSGAWPFVPMVVGIILMNLSRSRFAPHNADLGDLMFIGGALLAFTSIFTSYAWRSPQSTGAAAPISATCYSGLWFRFVAGLLDALFAGLVVAGMPRVIIDLARLAGVASNWSRRVADLGTGELVLLLCGFWLYCAAMESSPLEGTVGKLMLRLRVTDLEGHRLTFLRATLRYLGKLLSVGAFLLGFLMAVSSKRNQALHDLVAKTVVVDA
jgi:uncharacterized RDD family membrane protein YckC